MKSPSSSHLTYVKSVDAIALLNDESGIDGIERFDLRVFRPQYSPSYSHSMDHGFLFRASTLMHRFDCQKGMTCLQVLRWQRVKQTRRFWPAYRWMSREKVQLNFRFRNEIFKFLPKRYWCDLRRFDFSVVYMDSTFLASRTADTSRHVCLQISCRAFLLRMRICRPL